MRIISVVWAVSGWSDDTAQRAANLTEIEGWDNEPVRCRHNTGQHQASTLPHVLRKYEVSSTYVLIFLLEVFLLLYLILERPASPTNPNSLSKDRSRFAITSFFGIYSKI